MLIIGGGFITAAGFNYFKLIYRNEPVFPWDLLVFSEALEISSEMEVKLTLPIIISFIVVFIMFASVFLILYISKKRKKSPQQKKISPLIYLGFSAFSAFLLVLFCTTVLLNTTFLNRIGITENQFMQSKSYNQNGFVPSFVMNIKYIAPQKPEDYNKQTVSNVITTITQSVTEQEEKITPNIIIIMSEAYSDISLMKNVTFYDDIFTCTDNLKENHISGYVLTPQYGGGTSNSEFEVLTGYTMANLPTGCTPYQQYFKRQMPSYPGFLKQLGYTTVAIHSYGREFWNRDTAYNYMGFDKFLAEDNFKSPQRRRGLIKDIEVTNMIIREYEDNLNTGKPFFNFSVTMQNHGLYKPNQYLADYRVKLDAPTLNEEMKGTLISYATGIRDANSALQELIDYFSTVDEPTIIAMFGDHLGNLGTWNGLYYKSGYMGNIEEDLESKRMFYSPPFFIWDNYQYKNFKAENISMYQLIPLITKTYGLERPLFFDYLIEQSEYYKGYAQGVYLDADGNPVAELSDEAEKYFDTHRLLQYDLMFGNNYSAQQLYGIN